MSLMYDALRELEAPGSARDAGPTARPSRRVLAGTGVGLALAAVAAFAWQAPDAAPATVARAAPAQQPLVAPVLRDRGDGPLPATPDVSSATDPSPSEEIAGGGVMSGERVERTQRTPVLPAASGDAPATFADVAAEPSAAAAPPTTASPLPREAASGTKDAAAAPASAAGRLTIAVANRRTAGADSPDAEGDPRAVERTVARLEQAMRGGDAASARNAVGDLSRLLPADSLTLLRMRAWVAHEGGEHEAAIAAYREIARRMPGDRAASINLATLEAARGERDAARERLLALRTRAGDSPEITAALARVEGMGE